MASLFVCCVVPFVVVRRAAVITCIRIAIGVCIHEVSGIAGLSVVVMLRLSDRPNNFTHRGVDALLAFSKLGLYVTPVDAMS